MKIGMAYARVTKQTFRFDESDLRRAIEAEARRVQAHWCRVPDGCTERIDIDIDHDPNDIDEGYVATVTRTFSKTLESPDALAAVAREAE